MNKSCVYLLPIFCNYLETENAKLDENYFMDYLINCYCQNQNKNTIKFIIEFKKTNNNDENYNLLFDNLKKSNIFVKNVDLEKSILFEFKIPRLIEDDYYNFINGNFSLISNKGKQSILRFNKKFRSKQKSDEVREILYKSNTLKDRLSKRLGMNLPEDIELSSKPKMLEETFK